MTKVKPRCLDVFANVQFEKEENVLRNKLCFLLLCLLATELVAGSLPGGACCICLFCKCLGYYFQCHLFFWNRSLVRKNWWHNRTDRQNSKRQRQHRRPWGHGAAQALGRTLPPAPDAAPGFTRISEETGTQFRDTSDENEDIQITPHTSKNRLHIGEI